MIFTLAALALWVPAVAQAQEASDADTSSEETPPPPASPEEAPPAPPAPLPPAEAPPDTADLDDEIAAFLGEDASTAAAPPPATQARAAAPNVFNPRITAFGDLMTTVGFDSEGVMPGSGPWLRSLELDIRADVDPFAKAVAVIALEQEAPELEHHDEEGVAEEEEEEDSHSSFSASPEEVYIDLVSLPGGLSSRIGQQKLPFGLTNRMHPHDWAWPDVPTPFEAAMGEEGMADVAATLAWRIPNPLGVGLTVTGAITGGDVFDPHREDATPGWLGRAEYFGDYGQVELGLGASSTGQDSSRVDGADLMLRWRKDSWHSVVLMGELFRPVDSGSGGPIGWTSTLQLQPTRPLYVGLRVDDQDGDWQYAGFLSYYTSEFLRLRAGATTDLDSWIAHAQLTFVWGSHPVEPYWVNR